MKKKQFVFICGCGHTGTTITAKILKGHSMIYAQTIETGILLANRDYKRSKMISDIHKELVRQNKALYIEKTPRHIWHIDYARRIIKNTKFILCIRNPRDTIASLTKRYEDLGSGWRRYIDESALTIRQIDLDDVYLHDYDKFVKNPINEISKLCGFLGIDYEPEMINVERREDKWFDVKENNPNSRIDLDSGHSKRRSWQVNQPIFDGSNQWEKILSEDEKRRLDGLLNTEESQWIASRLGYKV